MNAPPRVFMDERVAARLPETTAEAQEGIGQDVDVIAYVREDVHLEAVRAASNQGQEFVVQITNRPNEQENPRLIALTNFGRLFGEAVDGWHEIALPEFET